MYVDAEKFDVEKNVPGKLLFIYFNKWASHIMITPQNQPIICLTSPKKYFQFYKPFFRLMFYNQ